MRGLWGDGTRREGRARLLPIAIILLGCLVCWSGLAQGADPTKRFSFAGQGGFAYYQMGDVNSRIRSGNRYLATQSWTELGSLHLGFNFTADFRARLTKRLGVSVGTGSTFGQSQVDFKQVITVKPSGNFYHARVTYLLPFRPISSTMLSAGAGPVYFPKATLKVTHEIRADDDVGYERTISAHFEGKGWGAHAFLQTETVLNDKATLVMDLGYRLATISRDEGKDDWRISGLRDPYREDPDNYRLQNQYNLNPGGLPSYETESFLEVVKQAGTNAPQVDSNGRPVVTAKDGMDLDFSGVVLNIGLRFYLF
jgi:hypothetical protein